MFTWLDKAGRPGLPNRWMKPSIQCQVLSGYILHRRLTTMQHSKKDQRRFGKMNYDKKMNGRGWWVGEDNPHTICSEMSVKTIRQSQLVGITSPSLTLPFIIYAKETRLLVWAVNLSLGNSKGSQYEWCNHWPAVIGQQFFITDILVRGRLAWLWQESMTVSCDKSETRCEWMEEGVAGEGRPLYSHPSISHTAHLRIIWQRAHWAKIASTHKVFGWVAKYAIDTSVLALARCLDLPSVAAVRTLLTALIKRRMSLQRH